MGKGKTGRGWEGTGGERREGEWGKGEGCAVLKMLKICPGL